jgi:hypothetical protein
MGGGSAGGSGMGGGSAGGGPVPVFPALAIMPNSRFVAMTGLDSTSGAPTPVVVTVREPLTGGASIVEGWTGDGGVLPSVTRTFRWDAGLQVHAIAGNALGMLAVGGLRGNDVMVEHLNRSTLATVGIELLETQAVGGNTTVSRMTMLPITSNPTIAFVQGAPNRARIYRLGTGGTTSIDLMSSGQPLGDDVIDSPTPPLLPVTPRLLMTGRCTDGCSIGGYSSTNMGLASRFAWLNYGPATVSLGPVIQYSMLLNPTGSLMFNGNFKVRAAGDEKDFIYFAGQSTTGQLIVNRRDAMMAQTDATLTSTGALSLADILTARGLPAGVLVLTNYQSSGVAFGGSLNWSTGDATNIALFRVSETSALSGSHFAIPGDQRAVAFAHGPPGLLYVTVNEGQNAVLWRVPSP